MLREVLVALKWWGVNSVLLLRNRRQRSRALAGGPVVFIDLHHNPYERYLVILLLLFRNSGHRIAFRPRPGMLASWSTTLLQRRFPEAQWCSDPPEETVLVLSDRARSAPKGAPLRIVDADYFTRVRTGSWHIPMPMVDSVYVFPWERPTTPAPGDALADLSRIRIYFSGGFDPAHYDRPELWDAFQCLTRHRMNVLLHAQFSEHLDHPKDNIALARSSRPIRIVDRHNDFYVHPRDLRWILAHTDFLPAFPGVVMPWTHSIVEGMSLGAIPILQYPHLFNPPLIPGINCLSFTDEEGWQRAVQLALEMPEEDVARMRASVKVYYDQHMAPSVVVQRLLDPASGDERVHLMAEWHSVRLLQRRQSNARHH